MSFQYILIPADASKPIITKEGTTEGGLQDDYLVKTAKAYFSQQSGSHASATAAMIEKSTAAERKALAAQIRQNTPGCEKFDDDFLIQMFKTTQGTPSCEIQALVVPKPSNQNIGVSMYSADNAKTQNYPKNSRAMDIMRACGHAITDSSPNCVCGDVFVGRYHDDEAKDIWIRVDFTEKDLNPDSDWCRNARKEGGGGGLGIGSAPPSLSGMMTKSMSSGLGTGGNFGVNSAIDEGEKNGENGSKWSQTSEEVELRFNVAAGTKAKYVKVAFARNTLKVTVAGQTLISGRTGGEVVVDESTYTLQDTRNGKELTVTLGKRKEGISWEHAVKNN